MVGSSNPADSPCRPLRHADRCATFISSLLLLERAGPQIKPGDPVFVFLPHILPHIGLWADAEGQRSVRMGEPMEECGEGRRTLCLARKTKVNHGHFWRRRCRSWARPRDRYGAGGRSHARAQMASHVHSPGPRSVRVVGASAAQRAPRDRGGAVGTVFVAQIGRWGTLGFY